MTDLDDLQEQVFILGDHLRDLTFEVDALKARLDRRDENDKHVRDLLLEQVKQDIEGGQAA